MQKRERRWSCAVRRTSCPRDRHSILVLCQLCERHIVVSNDVARDSCTLADVLLPDGTNVNQVLVKDGWCWWYRKYAPLDIELEKLEKDAGEAKKGLWADPAPIAPWLYRKAKCGQVLAA